MPPLDGGTIFPFLLQLRPDQRIRHVNFQIKIRLSAARQHRLQHDSLVIFTASVHIGIQKLAVSEMREGIISIRGGSVSKVAYLKKGQIATS